MFFLGMKPKSEMKSKSEKKAKRKTRIDLGKSHGITKYEYEMLDDIDLLCEMGFLIQCDIIDRCRACRQLLKFCIKILLNRWDKICFINFFDALKILKDNKDFFKTADILLHWRDKRTLVRDLIREHKI